MNSIKNLFVILTLMGVSYGAFQVINAPDPTLSGDSEVEALDIHIGPRTDSPAASNSMLADRNSPGQSPPPSLPPLPPNLNKHAVAPPHSNPPQGAPPTDAGELKMPEVEIQTPEMLTDPVAFSTSPQQAPPQHVSPRNQPAAGGFNPPPAVAEGNDFASRPIPLTGSDQVATSGGGTFNPVPQTQLEPVTPKQFTPPISTDSFEQQANGLAQGIANQARDGIETVRDQVQEQLVQPARDASDMLATAPVEVTGQVSNMARDLIANSPVTTTPPAPTRTTPSQPSAAIDWDGINGLASSGNPQEALKRLSMHYDANLPQDQRLQMLEWLDLLAGKVIYSTEHLLMSRPHVVNDGDTLESLAATWKVPAQLIYNVNSSKITDPTMLVPGTEIKVIQGPFNAVVNLERQELVLFLNQMYAGRFPIEIGVDGNGIAHGDFAVRQKQEGQTWVDANGQTLAAQAPGNPYGKYWIGLAENLAIHESNPLPGQQDNRGSIRLSSRDAADVYGILSDESQVTIRR